jgi:polygalacturonase
MMRACVTLTLLFSLIDAFADPAINTNNVIVVTNAPYNAVGDGVTTNTTQIQNAVNVATSGGLTNGLRGGVVEIPAGVFLSGPLTMKSSVNLHIVGGATLKMLPYGQYPTNSSPPDFIAANNLDNIAISGSGAIEGQGAPWWAAFDTSGINRPKAMFAPSNCRTVLVENVTLQNPPNTHISLRNLCREVVIRGITINTTSDVISVNTDGIDVNATNCVIQNCFISCGDDHIAIGGDSGGVIVTNCIFGNGHGVSIGSHTDGGLNNILVNDCQMTIASGLSSGIRLKAGRDRGGFVRNLTYQNVNLTNNQNPIFISSYYPDNTIPANPTTDTGSIVTATTPIWRDIVISNVTGIAASGRNAGRIYGLPEMPITNLTLIKTVLKADKGVDLYHVRNAKFIDTQINVPASINAFNLYNVDLTITNGTFNTNLVKLGGWSSASITNQLAFFNARITAVDTNILPRTATLTLANAVLAVSNSWSIPPATVMNFTLGTSNATVAVTGNLTFNGTVNIAAGPGFTTNGYILFTYSGGLTWGAPVLGSVPIGYNCSFDTNAAGQIKVRLTAAPLAVNPVPISFELSTNQLQLTWPMDHLGWHLEIQTNALSTGLNTNWFTAPNSAITNRFFIPLEATSPTFFIRLAN